MSRIFLASGNVNFVSPVIFFLTVLSDTLSELDLLHVSPLFGICQEVFFRKCGILTLIKISYLDIITLFKKGASYVRRAN